VSGSEGDPLIIDQDSPPDQSWGDTLAPPPRAPPLRVTPPAPDDSSSSSDDELALEPDFAQVCYEIKTNPYFRPLFDEFYGDNKDQRTAAFHWCRSSLNEDRKIREFAAQKHVSGSKGDPLIIYQDSSPAQRGGDTLSEQQSSVYNSDVSVRDSDNVSLSSHERRDRAAIKRHYPDPTDFQIACFGPAPLSDAQISVANFIFGQGIRTTDELSGLSEELLMEQLQLSNIRVTLGVMANVKILKHKFPCFSEEPLTTKNVVGQTARIASRKRTHSDSSNEDDDSESERKGNKLFRGNSIMVGGVEGVGGIEIQIQGKLSDAQIAAVKAGPLSRLVTEDRFKELVRGMIWSSADIFQKFSNAASNRDTVGQGPPGTFGKLDGFSTLSTLPIVKNAALFDSFLQQVMSLDRKTGFTLRHFSNADQTAWNFDENYLEGPAGPAVTQAIAMLGTAYALFFDDRFKTAFSALYEFFDECIDTTLRNFQGVFIMYNLHSLLCSITMAIREPRRNFLQKKQLGTPDECIIFIKTKIAIFLAGAKNHTLSRDFLLECGELKGGESEAEVLITSGRLTENWSHAPHSRFHQSVKLTTLSWPIHAPKADKALDGPSVKPDKPKLDPSLKQKKPDPIEQKVKKPLPVKGAKKICLFHLLHLAGAVTKGGEPYTCHSSDKGVVCQMEHLPEGTDLKSSEIALRVDAIQNMNSLVAVLKKKIGSL
jgi:hypothetical protein